MSNQNVMSPTTFSALYSKDNILCATLQFVAEKLTYSLALPCLG